MSSMLKSDEKLPAGELLDRKTPPGRSGLKFTRINEQSVDWALMDSLPDRTVFQTREWLNFVKKSQGAIPVIASVAQDGTVVAYFTGLMLKKAGFRILGSPFPGWTTDYLGFNVVGDISRRELLPALREFAFRELGCLHMELMDRRISLEEADGLGLEYRKFSSFQIDLRKNESQLLEAMSTAVRYNVRKADKPDGVIIEVANDPGFVDDYYNQLRDVFGKQELVPTFDRDRVQKLFDAVHCSGRLLLLRARDQEGRCIATGVFPAMNDTMHFWGGASYREFQKARPNEPLQWFAMKYWKARGITKYDMGGGGAYKEKYGGERITVPWIRSSKYAVLGPLRRGAEQAHKILQRCRGFLKAKISK